MSRETPSQNRVCRKCVLPQTWCPVVLATLLGFCPVFLSPIIDLSSLYQSILSLLSNVAKSLFLSLMMAKV